MNYNINQHFTYHLYTYLSRIITSFGQKNIKETIITLHFTLITLLLIKIIHLVNITHHYILSRHYQTFCQLNNIQYLKNSKEIFKRNLKQNSKRSEQKKVSQHLQILVLFINQIYGSS